MEIIAGDAMGVSAFLDMGEENPLGICVSHDYGAVFLTLAEFVEESLIGLSIQQRQRYAGAFEIVAKQLRG